MSCQGAYEATIRRLRAIDPQTYHLTPEAFAVWYEFQKWYYQRKKDERVLKSDNAFMEAMGKLEGTTARLALVLHLCERPNESMVGVETMERAIEIAKYMVVPALRYTFIHLTDRADSFERWIQEHIIAVGSERSTVTLSAIRRSARRQFDEGVSAIQQETDVRLAMDNLVAGGWVAVLEENKKTTLYAINQTICNLYRDYRWSVIEAKQRREDDMRESVQKWTPQKLERKFVTGYLQMLKAKEQSNQGE